MSLKLQSILKKKSISYYASTNALGYTQSLVDQLVSYLPNPVQSVLIKESLDVMIVHITDLRSTPIVLSAFLIILSGEPWQLGQTVDMSISPFQGQNASIEIYYPFLYSSLSERRIQAYEIKQKKHFCAFMYYQSYPHRDRYFHLLSQIKPVVSLGKACSTKSQSWTRFVNNEKETYNDIAVKLYASFKFVLAIENTWKEGYVTEKLINPLIANSVPLYWGHPSAFEFINKKRVIYLPDFTDEALLTYLRNIKEEEYEFIMKEPWYTDKGKPDIIQENLNQNIKKIFTSTE